MRNQRDVRRDEIQRRIKNEKGCPVRKMREHET